jgi:hypothetical protein
VKPGGKSQSRPDEKEVLDFRGPLQSRKTVSRMPHTELVSI